MTQRKSGLQRTTLSQLALGFLFCVLFPGFITAIAPVSWIRFERHDHTVLATAKTCVFFVIPYRIQRVEPVVGIGDHFIAGKISSRRSGESSHNRTRSEDEAFLEIHGEELTAEVPVSPFNIKSVVQRSKDFLTDPTANELKLTVIANWKFGLIAGGLASLLTVLYVTGIVLLFIRFVCRLAGFRSNAST